MPQAAAGQFDDTDLTLKLAENSMSFTHESLPTEAVEVAHEEQDLSHAVIAKLCGQGREIAHEGARRLRQLQPSEPLRGQLVMRLVVGPEYRIATEEAADQVALVHLTQARRDRGVEVGEVRERGAHVAASPEGRSGDPCRGAPVPGV